MSNEVPLEMGIDEGGESPVAGRSPWELAWLRLRKDKTAIVSSAVILLIVLLAIFAPLIGLLAGHGPNAQYLLTGLSPDGLPKAPSSSFLFGTDNLGRDIMVRTVYGARVSLIVGLAASLSAVIVGTTVGMVAGFVGGKIDLLLSRFMVGMLFELKPTDPWAYLLGSLLLAAVAVVASQTIETPNRLSGVVSRRRRTRSGQSLGQK